MFARLFAAIAQSYQKDPVSDHINDVHGGSLLTGGVAAREGQCFSVHDVRHQPKKAPGDVEYLGMEYKVPGPAA